MYQGYLLLRYAITMSLKFNQFNVSIIRTISPPHHQGLFWWWGGL